MYLKHKPSGDLVEILDLTVLANPSEKSVTGRFHVGEELQDPGPFRKDELVFPSDEPLPRCWVDPDYKKKSGKIQDTR